VIVADFKTPPAVVSSGKFYYFFAVSRKAKTGIVEFLQVF
jgi:hypothetical protein